MAATKMQFSDDQFIAGLRSGDGEVLNALYKKYYNIVLKFIVNNSGSDEAAQDIYQETIIVLYENAQNPDFSLQCQLQTYIYSVAKRLWLKQLRKSGKLVLLKEDAENDFMDAEQEIADHDLKEAEFQKMNKSLEE